MDIYCVQVMWGGGRGGGGGGGEGEEKGIQDVDVQTSRSLVFLEEVDLLPLQRNIWSILELKL